MTTIADYRDLDALPGSEAGRIAGLLGFPRPSTIAALDLADKVASGLPVRAADRLEPFVRRVARKSIHSVVSEPTLRRARKEGKPLRRDPSERLYDVARVLDEAAMLFGGDEDRIAVFLNAPHPLLDGRRAFDVATSSSAGADAVVQLIRRARAGVAI